MFRLVRSSLARLLPPPPPRCRYVLTGHSERRTLFGDDDDVINAKTRIVLDAGLKAVLCIGETKGEYEKGLNKEVCAIQVTT